MGASCLARRQTNGRVAVAKVDCVDSAEGDNRVETMGGCGKKSFHLS